MIKYYTSYCIMYSKDIIFMEKIIVLYWIIYLYHTHKFIHGSLVHLLTIPAFPKINWKLRGLRQAHLLLYEHWVYARSISSPRYDFLPTHLCLRLRIT